MMKDYILRVIGVVLLVASLTSCENFLSKEPDDRTQINDITSAKELAVSAYVDYSYVPLFELRCDNVGDMSSNLGAFNNYTPAMYFFEEVVPSTYQDSPQGFWRSTFAAVAAANQVLFDLDRIGATGPEADAVRGEVLLARAYNMYMLAQTFTVPYDPATAGNELGLPYPTEPEEELIKEYERGTLQETYDLIVKDFEEGFAKVTDDYAAPKFHFNRQAAAAFGTRLYRTLQNWDRVLELGQRTMGADPAMYVRKINVPGTPYKGTIQEMQQIWGMETEACNFLLNVAVSNWSRMMIGYWSRFAVRWPETAKGLFWNEYFLGDAGKSGSPIRFAYPFYGAGKYAYAPKIQEHFQVTNQSTGVGFVNTMTVLLTGDEVAFNMAEAHVMKGNYAAAIDLMQIIVNHFVANPNTPDAEVTEEKIMSFFEDQVGQMLPDPVNGIEINSFNPAFETTPQQESYLRAILDLKRRVFIHDGMRWMDNRQYRMDIVHNVFSNADSKEEFIVLRGTDPRYAYQLPSNVLPYLEKNPGYDKPLERLSK
ncbi:MAG: RagB/SusD family nutrient uptake outer membrane protein [Porphyromonas sp.]|nr:RagB/SusD family nutrient uptake outer membrane protein [Porphyromonas sp.]